MKRIYVILWFMVVASAAFCEGINNSNTYVLQPTTNVAARHFGHSYIPLDQGNPNSIMVFGPDHRKIKFLYEEGELRVDLNGDNNFDTENDISIRKRGSFTLPIEIGGRKMDYQIHVNLRSKRYAVVTGSMALKAEVNGVSYLVTDSNLNGVFGEVALDGLVIGKNHPIPLMKTFSLSDELYDVDVLGGGKLLQVSPYSGPIAELDLTTMDGWGAKVVLTSTNGAFQTEVTGKSTAKLLPGVYHIDRPFIGKPAADIYAVNKRPATYIYGRRGVGSPSLTLKEGANDLKVGSPFKMDFSVTRLVEDGSKLKITKAKLIGIAGAEYRAEVRSGAEKSKLECWVKSGDKEQLLSSMGYG